MMRAILGLFIAWGILAQPLTPPIEGEYLAYTDAAQQALYVHALESGITRALHVGTGGTLTLWDTSADGCYLLFSETPPNAPSQLYRVRLDGRDVRPLVDVSGLPAGAWDAWGADWSPLGDKIALTLSRPVDGGTEARVAWVPSEGGAPTFYSVAGDEHGAVWSADGAWLAYVAYEQRPAGSSIFATAEPAQAAGAPLLREGDLWKVSADGLTKERLTRFDVGSATSPRWSPNGELIGFTYVPSPNESQFWMIAAVPNAIPTQLSFTWNQPLALTWMPDGLAMLAAVRDFQDEPSSRLWQLPLVGNADTDATRYLLDVLPNTPADYPSFNADGTRLALRLDYTLAWVALADGAVFEVGGAGNTPPIWSPSGFMGESACATF